MIKKKYYDEKKDYFKDRTSVENNNIIEPIKSRPNENIIIDAKYKEKRAYRKIIGYVKKQNKK